MDIAAPLLPRPASVAKFLDGQHRLLIGDDWVAAASGETLDTLDPADGTTLASVASAGAEDVDRAVQAARRAFESGPWPSMPPNERARLIWRLADLIDANADEIALLESLDNGKPVGDARHFDLPHAIELFRYYAGWATKLNGESVALSNPGTWHAYTLREPVGVVGQIVPWNAPFMIAASKLAPALAAGCTMILKPAEQTPLTALRLGQLVQEAGFPPGVVNILTGYGKTAGAAMAAHPGIDKITFTGSTATGREIVHASTSNFKRVTLELGGKTPVIIFPDADMEKAIAGAARAIFSNTGQICNAGSRLYTHPDVFDQVIEGVADIARNIRLGRGTDPQTQMGPVISSQQLDRITGYIETGQQQGATLLSGGGRPSGAGYFVEPTILTDTTHKMDVVREEIFGPVLCAMKFDPEEIDRISAEANQSDFGLGAVIWTRDIGVAHGLARKLKAGTVRVNGGGLDPALPFGGFKASGWGRESGREGIEAYTEVKSVAVNY